MNASVIIPALNEETLLPGLLADLRGQTRPPLEIIVADAGSTDRTQSIAREAGAIVVPGGRPPAGRNNGARAAKGELLIFLDADVRVPPTFVADACAEFDERYLDLATCENSPLSDHPVDKLLHDFVNFAIKLSQFSDPHAFGYCTLVTRRLFERVGGFDESLRMAEDHDFVKRASHYRPLRVLRSAQVSVSVRRLEKEGRVRFVNKVLTVELHRLLFGEVKNDLFEYEFGNFTQAEQLLTDDGFKESQRLRDQLQQGYASLLASLGGRQSLSTVSPGRVARLRRQYQQWKEQLEGWLGPRRPPSRGGGPADLR